MSKNGIALFCSDSDGEINIAVTAASIVQKLICTVFVVKHGKRVINVP